MTPQKRKPRSSKSTGSSNNLVIQLTVFLIAATAASVYLRRLANQNTDETSYDVLDDRLTNNLDLAVKPFDGRDEFPLDPVVSNSPVWGTLNSGHYFGLKLTHPNSPEYSLMWFKNGLNNEGNIDIRHLCDQNDKLHFYAWTRHNFHTFGQQTIRDQNYNLETSFLKNPRDKLEWQARIQVSSNSTNAQPLSIINYISVDDVNDWLKVVPSDESFVIEGFSKALDNFVFTIEILDKNKKLVDTHLAGWIEKNRMTTSEYIKRNLSIRTHNGGYLFTLPASTQQPTKRTSRKINIIAHQFILDGSTSILLSFKRKSPNIKLSDLSARNEDLAETMTSAEKSFDERFRKIFPLDLNTTLMSGNIKPESIEKIAKVALSNLIGGVGYFYGTAFINAHTNPDKIASYGPLQLLSAVPSRSFFPRGFLWDEGFHNLLISRWDPSLSNAILESWFNTMNINGWMPREMILGIESMRRVPREFIVQGISNANPPVMLMTIEYMLDLGILEESRFNRLYPRLKLWFNWFNITQSGPQDNTFRWRGRDEMSVSMLNPKTLTSGLDDYPRASHPSLSEYHLDLRCWMTMATRTLAKLAKLTKDEEFYQAISRQSEYLSDNDLLDILHWNPQQRMYCDFGHNTEKAELIWVTKTRQVQNHYNGRTELETFKVLERHSTGHPTFGCVPEFGYVSLFPMILRVLNPASEKLGVILERLNDEDDLWTNFGIRSLSKSSKYYRKRNTEHDKPYWRGPIWLNLNYMILSALKHYSKLDGPYREECKRIFSDLKRNLVENVVNEFERTGYLWENYDDQTGRGQGSHPFTGWSSLIVLIMSENLSEIT